MAWLAYPLDWPGNGSVDVLSAAQALWLFNTLAANALLLVGAATE